MKVYTDLNTNFEDPNAVKFAAKLGFSRIGSEKVRTHSVIDLVSRFNITPTNANFLPQALRYKRFEHEIISVNCFTKSVARQAGKDHRVDIVKFPLKGLSNFDYHQANIMSNTGSAIEIEIRYLLEEDPFALKENIQQIGKQVRVAEKHDIPIILSSGAYGRYHLRDPKAIIALASLIQIEEDAAEKMITVVPNDIIDRNRARLSEKFVMPAVWLV